MKGFVKDPDASLDYSFNWSQWLGNDTIAASIWIEEPGITIVPASESFTTTTTTLFLSGGTVDQSYVVTNRITTAGGRTDERSMEIKIKNR